MYVCMYIYIRGYATIQGGRKCFIRRKKKDSGLSRISFVSSLQGKDYSSPCTLPSNELIIAYIIIIFQVGDNFRGIGTTFNLTDRKIPISFSIEKASQIHLATLNRSEFNGGTDEENYSKQSFSPFSMREGEHALRGMEFIRSPRLHCGRISITLAESKRGRNATILLSDRSKKKRKNFRRSRLRNSL